MEKDTERAGQDTKTQSPDTPEGNLDGNYNTAGKATFHLYVTPTIGKIAVLLLRGVMKGALLFPIMVGVVMAYLLWMGEYLLFALYALSVVLFRVSSWIHSITVQQVTITEDGEVEEDKDEEEKIYR